MRYPNLRAEMARADVGVDGLAMATGLSMSSIYRRLNSDGFSFDEAKSIRDTLFPAHTVDYLFGAEGGD